MKEYKKYVVGLLVCFMAFGLMSSSASAFWGFGKSKKENNANYAGAVANTRGSSSSVGATSITVISPNGGETVEGGKNYKIKWKSKNVDKKKVSKVSPVSIYLISYGDDWISKTIIATSTPNKGVYMWRVPVVAQGKNFKISIQEVNGYGGDESDGFFRITSNVEQPQITVVSPNGGETFQAGSRVNITWFSKDLTLAPLEIRLVSKNLEFHSYIARDVIASDGTFAWDIPFNIVPQGTTGAFKVNIVCAKGSCSDYSDNPFNIFNKLIEG